MALKQTVLRVAVLGVGAGLVLAGCGGSEEGTPTSQNSAGSAVPVSSAASAQWDPCSVPDSAISELGLNVATKDNKVAGTEFDGWKACHWQSVAKTYYVTVLSSEHTLAETQQRSDYEGYTPLTVGTHSALEFRPVGATRDIECWVSAEVPNGTVDFKVMNRYGGQSGGQTAGDPCDEVQRLSAALAQYLPS
ncbi:DUF3558 domain-containing protein [Nocardia sp. BMG51109]|uniref:DUF3558 domain-containing protein n=1 Tax=Nocardia sp. BMG51109 TaxID=1056816 RepID=UPI000464201F|nr:DUF3558 domain-containing protein [Nocardia sp. BMG51109]